MTEPSLLCQDAFPSLDAGGEVWSFLNLMSHILLKSIRGLLLLKESWLRSAWGEGQKGGKGGVKEEEGREAMIWNVKK